MSTVSGDVSDPSVVTRRPAQTMLDGPTSESVNGSPATMASSLQVD